MTLPASGEISMSMVNTELYLGATNLITLNDAAVRTLFGKPSGAISLNDGHGKAAAFDYTLVAGTTDLNYTQHVGYITGLIGSLSPTTFRGQTISEITDRYVQSGESTVFEVHFVLATAGLAKGFFDTLKVSGTTLSTSTATFTNSGSSHWAWSGILTGIAPPYTFPVTIT